MVSKLTKNDRTKMQHLCWCPNDKKESKKQDKIDYEIYSTSQNTFESMDEDSIISEIPQKIEKKTEDKKQNLFPYKFEWKGPGNNVVLTGSFLEYQKPDIILNLLLTINGCAVIYIILLKINPIT